MPSGADAVVYVADAQPSARRANFDYWRNMVENLRHNGMAPETLPIVIQFNKCDLLDAGMQDEIAEMRRTGFGEDDRLQHIWADETSCKPGVVCRQYPEPSVRAGIHDGLVTPCSRAQLTRIAA